MPTPRFLHLALHWDPEWVQTRLTSIRRFAMIMNHVVSVLNRNDSSIRRFSFDGQSNLVQLVGQIDTELGQQIATAVKKRQLDLGPWFVHTEPCLITGESLIRNLQLGIRIARQMGCSPTVAICPDAGGFPAQLPQLLKGCEISGFVGWRGVVRSEGDPIFWWRSPDGSVLAAAELTNGIGDFTDSSKFNAEGQPNALIKRYWRFLGERWGTFSPLWLCAVGGHLDGLDAFLQSAEDVTQVSLDEYFAQVMQETREVIDGELRDPRLTVLMSGAASIRMAEKTAMRQSERAMLTMVEPLAAMTLMLNGIKYRPALDAAWHELLQNQTEDILRGCGSDEIYHGFWHRQVEVRNLVAETTHEMMMKLSRMVDFSFLREQDQGLFVSNPFPHPYAGPIRLSVHVPPGERSDIQIVDAEGREIPAQFLGISRASQMVYQDNMKPPQLRYADYLDFVIEPGPAPIPAYGHRCFGVRKRETFDRLAPGWSGVWETPQFMAPVVTTPVLENESVHVEVRPDGTITLIDKKSQARFDGLHVLTDSADAGDTYNFSPLPNSEVITSLGRSFQISGIAAGPLYQAIKCVWELDVPAHLDVHRQQRSNEREPLKIETVISLSGNSRVVSFETAVHNSAQDHKVSVWFPFGATTESISVHQPFHVADRLISQHYTRGRYECHEGMGPQLDFAAMRSPERTLLLMNDGLPGYEVGPSAVEPRLGLTLLRSVGWLSRDDTFSRPWRAGPPIQTPSAQAEGRVVARYALAVGPGAWCDEEMLLTCQTWLSVLPYLQVDPDSRLQRYQFPSEMGFLEMQPDYLIITAFKPSADDQGVIVRVWNPRGTTSQAELQWKFDANTVEFCNLLEEAVETISCAGNRVSFAVGGHQVKTLRIK